jgi:hypothetical protein
VCVSSYFYLLLVRCRCTCMLLPCLTSTTSTTHLPHSHHPTHIVANPSRRPAACFCPSTTYELLRHDLFTTIQGQFIRFDHIFLCILAAKVNCCFLLSALHPSYRRLISVCLRLSSRRTTCSSSVHPTYLNSSFGPHDINDRHF